MFTTSTGPKVVVHLPSQLTPAGIVPLGGICAPPPPPLDDELELAEAAESTAAAASTRIRTRPRTETPGCTIYPLLLTLGTIWPALTTIANRLLLRQGF